uniref:Uncharacterized protein n=1 Tax=Anguilla anguilla TaxID=7936 RepID=A0A0E9VL17_ANGAN
MDESSPLKLYIAVILSFLHTPCRFHSGPFCFAHNSFYLALKNQ